MFNLDEHLLNGMSKLTFYLCYVNFKQDGIINDIDKTVEMLVKASTLPLSVIFLSVGPLDLFLMVSWPFYFALF